MSDSTENPGFTPPSVEELAPLFPGYDFQGLIACGGMGAVYCAVQRSLDRTVALKILPRELSKDKAFCESFEAEAKAMARLNHPNLIGVYDFGEVNGMLYIIMEFVPGQSLYHSAYGMAVDQLEVIRLVTGICNGLEHAHAAGILHRDIKPSNILLDLNAQPKIGDFGLARPIDRKIEEGEEIFGTPHYTAPEVVNAPHTVDVRADIFSVGVLLHELLTAKLPAEDPRPASTIVRCDPRFDTIIRRATQPAPASRYSSAAEIAKDLRMIKDSLTPKGPAAQGRAVPRPVVHGRGARRGPVRQSAKSGGGGWIIILLLVGLGGLGYFLMNGSDAVEDPKQSVVPPPVTPVAPTPKPVAPIQEEPTELLVRPKPPTQQPDSGFGETEEQIAASGNAIDNGNSGMTDVPPTPAVVAPKYDVDEFFGRARKIMKDKTQSDVANYHASLKENSTTFERSLARQIRRMKSVSASRRANEAMDSIKEEIVTADGRIPDRLSSSLSEIPDTDEIYTAALLKQTGIDDSFEQVLAAHADTYILGLQLQADRLKADNDTGAIQLIEAEIERTKNTPSTFRDLILGTKSGTDIDSNSDDQ